MTGGLFERVDLETVGGSLSLRRRPVARATLNVETVSGSVELSFPEGVAADFSVSSFSGGIDNALGPPARRTSRYTTEKELEFSTGGGGATVSVHTLSGCITLQQALRTRGRRGKIRRCRDLFQRPRARTAPSAARSWAAPRRSSPWPTSSW